MLRIAVGFSRGRRDAKAAKAFLNETIERVWLYRHVTIYTDKAHPIER